MPSDSVPEGYTTVTPWIITRDTAGLIEFLKHVFDAEEIGRVEGSDGRIGHAELRIGDAVIMAFDSPADWPETPAFIRLYLADAEAAFARAVNAGATSITEVTPLAFGDRVGRVRDPFGNIWWLQQHEEEVSQPEMQRRASDPRWLQAMDYVQRSLAEAPPRRH